MDRAIAALDVGTTKICTLISEITEDEALRIVGVGVTPSRGLSKGMIVNVEEASRAIAASVEKAERISGYKVEGAYVGLAGKHISSLNSRGVVAVGRGDRGITAEDVERAIESSKAIAIPHNREIIHVIPRGFTLDGQEGVRDPIGMVGFRLEVETHIVTGATASIQNLVKCVHSAGVHVNDLVLQPLASAEAVLTDEEREMGVVLVDAGGGTTDLAIFIASNVWHSLVLPVGGNNLTNDIAIGLRVPFTVAEELKIKYGHALPEAVDPSEQIDVAAFGDSARRSVSRRELASIIEARAEEMFALILREIKRSGYDGLLPAGVVLTGGTAQLPGFKDLGREVLQLPVRVGVPQNVEGLAEMVCDPAYATSVGLLLWGMQYEKEKTGRPESTGQSWEEIYRRFLDWLKVFLPR
ncbi:MAG: cell division protein FtsA [Chloroflexi bacterium]|nr:cell division protein FtsA [Chloroflexota bacterium]